MRCHLGMPPRPFVSQRLRTRTNANRTSRNCHVAIHETCPRVFFAYFVGLKLGRSQDANERLNCRLVVRRITPLLGQQTGRGRAFAAKLTRLKRRAPERPELPTAGRAHAATPAPSSSCAARRGIRNGHHVDRRLQCAIYGIGSWQTYGPYVMGKTLRTRATLNQASAI